MKKAVRNLFNKGLNRDTDKHQPQNQNLYWNENFRLITDEGQSNFLLENIKGNKIMKDLEGNDMGCDTNEDIIGHYIFDNRDIVLFATSHNELNNYPEYSKIYLYKYNKSEKKYYKRIELYKDTKNSIEGVGFRMKKNIYCVGRNETNFVKHLYWIDNINPIRVINIVPDIDISTNEPKAGIVESDYTNIKNSSINKFRTLPKFENADIIEFMEYGSGNLKSGMVQYSYRFFNKNGNYTNIGQSTALFPIFSAPDNSLGNNVQGDPPNTNTNKSFIGKLELSNINKDFDYVEIIGLHYNDTKDPQVNIVAIKEIDKDMDYIVFEDKGVGYIDQITFQEYREILNDFIPKTISSKDDRLFIGNITEDYFDVDYDARAYRFADDGNGYIRATIYEKDLTTYKNVTPQNWDTIPENHDAINFWKNYIEKDNFVADNPSFDFKYKSDGITEGGEGRNVEYEFILDGHMIDTTDNKSTFDIDLSNSNKSTKEYYLGIKRGLQRDEIYRCGIVFYDNKGRQSFVKWIGDIRTPTIFSTAISQNIGTDIKAYNLKIMFYIKNIPLNTDGSSMRSQIVYVKRSMNNRTVIAAGVDSPMLHALLLNNEKYYHNLKSNIFDAPTSPNADTGNIREFISPDLHYNELSFNNNILQRNNIFELYSDFYVFKEETSDTNNCLLNAQKLKHLTTKPTYQNNENHNLLNILNLKNTIGINYKWTNGSIDDANRSIFNVKTYMLNNLNSFLCKSELVKNPGGATEDKTNSTTFFNTVVLTNINNNTEFDTHNVVYSYIRSKNYPYNGADYNARLGNTYIPMSKISINYYLSSDYGDTYIGFYGHTRIGVSKMFRFDEKKNEFAFGSILDTYYTHMSTNAVGSQINRTLQNTGKTQTLYFPVETSIVLSLLHGFQMHKNISDINTYLISVNKNKRTITEEVVYSPVTDVWRTTMITKTLDYEDMFLYNPIYSKVKDDKIFISKPLIWEKNINFSNRIRYSDVKINGEIKDSWLRFRSNNMQDADSTYGQLEQLVNWKNFMFAFQHRGMCMLPINERATTSTKEGSQIVLGEGIVLPKTFNYAQGSNKYGLQNDNKVIVSEHGLYWLDIIEKKLLIFSGKTMEIEFAKGLSAWMDKSIDNNTKYYGIFDNKYKDILLSFYNKQIFYAPAFNKTLVYNEYLQAFQGIYTFNTNRFIDSPNILSVKVNNIYEHNIGNRTEWYGYNYSSIIELIINDKSMITKEFNNIEYMSESFDINGNDNYYDTFNMIFVENDFLNANGYGLKPFNNGDVLYTGGLGIPNTAPQNVKNIRRRERVWRTVIPRVKSNNPEIDNYRMRDAYIKLRLIYSNNNNYKFIVHPITTYYTMSNIE